MFSSKNGTSLSVNNLHNRSWKPLLKVARLPNIRFHDLRHTCATLLLSKGVHSKLVQESDASTDEYPLAWLAEAMREPPEIRDPEPLEDDSPDLDLESPVERVRRERREWADFFEKYPHLNVHPDDDAPPSEDERECPYCGEFTHEVVCPSCGEVLP